VLASKRQIVINFDKGGFGEFMMNYDKSKLYQSLSNLVNNSIKYSYENSTINVYFEKINESEISIKVQDQGIGIPESGKHRIFDRFYRAENAIKVQTDGTGLGLYFARAIVQDHGGQMWFDSIEGKGTTFSVKLPIN
jgi:signal transduction histidine kinase